MIEAEMDRSERECSEASNETVLTGRFESYERQIAAWIAEDVERMEELRLLRELGLPDWCIGAGYVRNLVWDKLHGYETPTPLNDVDVIYYDPNCTDEAREKSWERCMMERCPARKWSFKNQARMHKKSGRTQPYESTADAMMHWTEVMTAVGVRMEQDGSLTIVSPWGAAALEDLMALRIRRSPKFEDREAFQHRLMEKRWLEQWPRTFVQDID
ncbi:nucleotidyltransferase family protein [Paenibacillus marinisediminis]